MHFLSSVLLCLLAERAFSVNVELLQPYAFTAENMYKTSDFNHDNVLSIDELVHGFTEYDVNHDGIVSRHEYTSYVCFLTPALYQLSHYLYDQYDISPVDHRLEKSDFVAFYNKLDVDGDGIVGQTEWITWWVNIFQGLENAGYHQHGHSSEHGSKHCFPQ